MTSDICPIRGADQQQPTVPGAEQLNVIRQMLQSQRIAVVGLSNDEHKPSFRVANYLKKAGKTIVPVNPNHDSVFGLKSYASLDEVPGEIELVNVFRRPEFCADVVRAAIKRGVKHIWLQQGIRSQEAEDLARTAGIDFVQDRCIMVEHQSAL